MPKGRSVAALRTERWGGPVVTAWRAFISAVALRVPGAIAAALRWICSLGPAEVLQVSERLGTTVELAVWPEIATTRSQLSERE